VTSERTAFEEKPRHYKRLSRIGLIGTALYIAFLVLVMVASIHAGWIELSPMQLNQVGDVLAGLFGPLAIFWIVLGFFQQGEELRNSVNTLKLQAKELASSVEQQRELVQVTKQTLEHERFIAEQNLLKELEKLKPKPVIVMKETIIVDARQHYSISVSNTGYSVSEVKVSLRMGAQTIRTFDLPFWDTGARIEDGNIFLDTHEILEALELKIDYRSNQEARYELTYKLHPPSIRTKDGLFKSELISESRYSY